MSVLSCVWLLFCCRSDIWISLRRSITVYLISSYHQPLGLLTEHSWVSACMHNLNQRNILSLEDVTFSGQWNADIMLFTPYWCNEGSILLPWLWREKKKNKSIEQNKVGFLIFLFSMLIRSSRVCVNDQSVAVCSQEQQWHIMETVSSEVAWSRWRGPSHHSSDNPHLQPSWHYTLISLLCLRQSCMRNWAAG